ncbi:MAG TPA: hypothetical protein PLI31_02610 [Methanoregulaceae archaeon]|nr:hypothetical protein [Methanoregulaceae archaeon]
MKTPVITTPAAHHAILFNGRDPAWVLVDHASRLPLPVRSVVLPHRPPEQRC